VTSYTTCILSLSHRYPMTCTPLLTHLLTYLLTQWSRVLLEKLTGFAASRFPVSPGFFPWHLTAPCALGSTQLLQISTRLILGVKTAVRKADNLPPSCADVKKSGDLNLLEPCVPVQACNGTGLPLPLLIFLQL
jgi:hypothetical protein